MERFSNRQGYRGTEQEIAIREDAPEGLVAGLASIVALAVWAIA